jgi:L-fuconolactonase
MQKIIDPHLHFFALEKGQYHWLKPQNPPFWPDKQKINRSFSEQDLSLGAEFTLAGFVHIEAGFDNLNPWREIDWLEKSCLLPFKSIAGIDLTAEPSAFKKLIEQVSQYKSVVGVRHILDENAKAILSKPQAKTNLAFLAKQSLIFELQYEVADFKQHQAVMAILSDLPTLKCVLNHAGFCPINAPENWQKHLLALAKRPNCWIKVSGWEMLDRHYPKKTMAKRLAFLVKVFTHDKIMFASNFPLVLLQKSYLACWQDHCALSFEPDLSQKLLYENAKACYGF